MTIIQLECVLEAAQQGNFSRAAANLYLSQPTLSRHIQALENELHTQIFLRANNTVCLTETGRLLLPKLQQLYEFFRKTSVEMHEIVNHVSGQLKIGILSSMAIKGRFRELLLQFHQLYPDVSLDLCHLKLQESYSALMGGGVDLLFSLDASMPPSDKLRTLPLSKERMCLAVPADHPNSNLVNIAHNEIQIYFPDLKFSLVDIGEFEPPAQVDLRAVYADCTDMEIGSQSDLDSLMMLVDAGLGITCANENCILTQNPRVKLIPLVERRKDGLIHMQTSPSLYWIEKNSNPYLHTFLQLFTKAAPAHT